MQPEFILARDKMHFAIPVQVEPEEFNAQFPMAKVGEKNGKRYAVFPYNDDVVRELKAASFDVPATIRHRYSTGSLKPFEAQLAAMELFTLYKRCFCLNDMGAGKTLSALWAYDFLRIRNKAGRALVVAPLSTLEDTWEREVARHLPFMSAGVLHGTAQKRKKVLRENHDLYIVNHDGLKVIAEELVARPDIDTFIIDELSAFRNPKAERTTVLRALAKTRERVWGMTATPTPNSPTDCYSQVQIVRPTNLGGMRFTQFRDEVMERVSNFTWEPKQTAAARVHELMSPSVRYSLDDCTNLPETLYLTRRAPLSAAQAKAYKQMMKKFTIEGTEVNAANEAIKLQKLIQIGGGFAYDQNQAIVEIGCNERLKVLDDVLHEFDDQFLLFCPFSAGARMIHAHLEKKREPTSLVIGATTNTERKAAFDDLRAGRVRGIVAHPRTMSHGLNLIEAKTVIWFSPYPSLETFQQANRRVRRPGQKSTTRVVAIVASNAEVKIYNRLKRNENVQGALLELIREQTQKK